MPLMAVNAAVLRCRCVLFPTRLQTAKIAGKKGIPRQSMYGI